MRNDLLPAQQQTHRITDFRATARFIKRTACANRQGMLFRKWRNYLRPTTVAGYIGWVGHSNVGDEALFQAFLRLFPDIEILLFKEENFDVPLELYLTKWAFRRNRLFNIVFLGGGTLVQNPESRLKLEKALARDTPCCAFGTGVRERFWLEGRGVDYAAECDRWKGILPRLAYVGVRGPRSARIFEEEGWPRAEVIGDPALSICESLPEGHSRSGKIGINVGSHDHVYGSQTDIDETAGRLGLELLRRGWEIQFIPMHPIDIPRCEAIRKEFGLRADAVKLNSPDVGQTLKQLATYDLVISQRLHGVVLAAGQGVPVIALEYQPKCADFMESMDIEEFSIRTDRLELDRILNMVEVIDSRHTAIRQRLIRKAEHYRVAQRLAASKVMDLIAVNAAGSVGTGLACADQEPQVLPHP